jgi:integrase
MSYRAAINLAGQLRPSEEIALTIRDFDEAHGTLSVTKARVLGMDKDTTKAREDRIIQLSPRALVVLKRQLALYRDLKSRRLIGHNQLFFKDDGTSIRHLSYPAKRWRLSPIAPGIPRSVGIS